MVELTIGELARECGVAPSALRFYEREGLLPAPPRASKRRLYDKSVLGRLRIILLARAAGFSIKETRMFLSGFPIGTKPALRWREMATKKIAELDEQAAQLTKMRSILSASFHCDCRVLEDCERLIATKTSNARQYMPQSSAAQLRRRSAPR
jgi:DNA-binding transcriptional MerR regulator